MSLAQKAARGALWTVISSMGGRAIGVIGTLVITRFLHPKDIGEVAAATVLAMSANWITIWGFGQYAVVKGRGPDALEVTFHAAVAYAALGAISLGAMALFGGACFNSRWKAALLPVGGVSLGLCVTLPSPRGLRAIGWTLGAAGTLTLLLLGVGLS